MSGPGRTNTFFFIPGLSPHLGSPVQLMLLFVHAAPFVVLSSFRPTSVEPTLLRVIALLIIFTSPHRSYIYLPGRHLRRHLRPLGKHNGGTGNYVMMSIVSDSKPPRKLNSLVRCPLFGPHCICNFHDSPVSVI